MKPVPPDAALRAQAAWAGELPPQAQPVRETLLLPDGYETVVYAHRRVGSAERLPVLYLHGIQSHPGWFVRSAAHLAGQGHAVFQVTRRGSGENLASRGHAASAAQLLADVQAAIEWVQSRTGSDRLHGVGVSWGGKLLARFLAAAGGGESVASAVLVAPGIVPRVGVSAWTRLAIGAALLCCRRKLFAVPLSEPALFTDNPAMRAYLQADRHRLHRATAAFLYASRRMDWDLARAPAGAITVPVTLLLAGRDRIIDAPATAAAVRRLTEERAEVHTFDAAHTLEFESDPTPFFEALAAALAGAEAP